MFERIWNTIKLFFINHSQHAWLEYTMLILAGVGLVTIIFLLIRLIKKINLDIKQLEKDKRKTDKKLLKFLGRKNKTN